MGAKPAPKRTGGGEKAKAKSDQAKGTFEGQTKKSTGAARAAGEKKKDASKYWHLFLNSEAKNSYCRDEAVPHVMVYADESRPGT